ncbi:aldehyde dehydrogenase family protein [Roseospira visakhapatnamensis]|uniref:aldehyde dehydrogenase (NAD(+)) n=1 Tax=Roseospira visakhapatnamensis TaxID=390880 RepID=A0A7W6RBZ4_9PROT|nr:aldehyde dehydrogenase family protein [Roseospira visakhapatnamensis]MBB4265642.1 acyl-CoA reductase-like NAD-dependent aldehyde dehydrogenase [Roseospira visakhapatnamensis]
MVTPLWVRGQAEKTDETITSINPADGTIAGTCCAADARCVDQAVRATHDAWCRSDWPHRLPHERARVLAHVADALDGARDTLAVHQMRDCGKPLAECRRMVTAAAGAFRYYAAVLECEETEVTPPRGPSVSMTVLEPLGVVALVTPWNSPIMLEGQKAAPALAAGNAVVIKPSEETPHLALHLARLCVEAGVPPALLTVLPGRGETTGAAVVGHPLVRMVSFTGGTETGRAIGRVCAEKIIPAALELGGKSPHIVFEDADLDRALDAVTAGIFGSAGQSCVAGSRLLVQASIAEPFIARVAARADALRVGPPDHPDTAMGPLISTRHRDRVESYIRIALRDDGGRLRAGGGRPDDPALAAGAYLRPTVIDGLPNTARCAQEEIFGPVLACIPFRDEDEAIELANDTVFGLAAGIWSGSFDRAWRVGRAIQAGSVWINCYKRSSISAPFGGFKDSGLLREKGRQGLRLYGGLKSISVGLDAPRAPARGEA